MRERRSFRNALGWSFVMTGGQQVIGLAITFVLAGMLGPRVFGTVAIATVYVAFVQLLVSQGMVPALVQRRELRAEHLDTAFWMTVAAAAVMTVASLVLAPAFAALNDLPDLRDVIWVLSATIPLKALTVVPEADLRRRMEFRTLAARTNTAALVGGVVGVTAAVAGAGVWALVAQQLTAAVVEVVTLWALGPWRPRRRFDRAAAAELWTFTSGALVAAVGTFVHNRGDVLFLGIFFGPLVVGLYRLGARLVNVVVDVSAKALQHAALPELARLQDDPAAFRRRTVELLRITAILSWPAFGLLAGVAPWLLDLLGDEWSDATASLQLLSVTGAVTALGLVVAATLQASGRPLLFAKVTWSAAAVSAAGLVAAGWLLDGASVATQVAGVAAVRAAIFIGPLLLVNLVVLRASCAVSIRAALRTMLPAAVAGSAGVATGLVLWASLPAIRTGVPGGLAAGPLVALVIGLVLWRLEPDVGRRLAQAGEQVRQRARPTPAADPERSR